MCPEFLTFSLGRTSALQAASSGSSETFPTNLNILSPFEEGQTPTGHYQSQNTQTFPVPVDISRCWKTFPESPHFILNAIRIPNFPNTFLTCSRKRRLNWNSSCDHTILSVPLVKLEPGLDPADPCGSLISLTN